MSYIQLPTITYKKRVENNINFVYSDFPPLSPFLNKTLYAYLTNIKCEIDNCQSEWDKYKKYMNTYEYIHTPVSGSVHSICKLSPLSRSYYKMVEISNILSVAAELPSHAKTFHLAEGPGGFIEAIADMRKDISGKYNLNDIYYGMTLINDSDTSIPGWRKTSDFIKKCPNFTIEPGIDGKGDLTNVDNLNYCHKKYKGSVDLITGDGGFDFSVDFNNQEVASAKLLFCQIAFATAMQKKGGSFIIKFFDTFTQFSSELIYLLTILYETVFFIKPCSSRQANSEKYIVCKKFRLEDTTILVDKFTSAFEHIKQTNYITKILNIEIPYVLSVKIEEYNAICGQQQIESIANTLNLIENNKFDKLETLKKYNVLKCKQWCQKYKLPHHKNIVSNNVFLQKQ